MFRVIVITSALLSLSFQAASQDASLKNNAYVGFFSDASIVSVNYERILLHKGYFYVSPRIGFGYNSELNICRWCPAARDWWTVPHGVSLSAGNGEKFIGAGIGGMYRINSPFTEEYFNYFFAELKGRHFTTLPINARVGYYRKLTGDLKNPMSPIGFGFGYLF